MAKRELPAHHVDRDTFDRYVWPLALAYLTRDPAVKLEQAVRWAYDGVIAAMHSGNQAAHLTFGPTETTKLVVVEHS